MRRRASALAQDEVRAQRDQGGRRVADGRAIGDIAADRAGIAHLAGAQTPDQLAEIGIGFGQHRLGIAVGRGGADPDPAGLDAYVAQGGDPADMDDRRQVAMLFRDPESDIGGAADNRRIGVFGIELCEFVGVYRGEISMPVMSKAQGHVLADGRKQVPFAVAALLIP